MFSCLFGWRHASKCKKLVRRLQCRIKLLKNKRSTIVRQLRDDIAQLIKTGYHDIAIDRAEVLIKDKDVVALYELLDHFCEFVVLNMRYIRSHKDCPNDMNEAISSLIFASARFGDMPELIKIRKLFGERYGDNFAVSAVELLPGNLVNLQIIEELSIKSVTEDAKKRLVSQIASDYCLQPEILAFEYASEIDKEMKDQIKQHAKTTVEVLGSSSENKKDKMMTEASLGENSTRFDRSKVVYLDDVEEVRYSPQSNIDTQDKRMFKFKALPTKAVVNLSCKKECSLEEDDFLENKKAAIVQKQDLGRVSSSATLCKTGNLSSKKDGSLEEEGFLENKKSTIDHKQDLGTISSSDESSKATNLSCKKEVSLEKEGFLENKKPALDSKQDTGHVSGSTVYNVFTYPSCKASKTNMEEFESCDSDCSSSECDELPLPPYTRVMTAPSGWLRRFEKSGEKKTRRSNSCPSQYPNHVHPKLPDCDEIAAKFSALKKEYIQTSSRYCEKERK